MSTTVKLAFCLVLLAAGAAAVKSSVEPVLVADGARILDIVTKPGSSGVADVAFVLTLETGSEYGVRRFKWTGSEYTQSGALTLARTDKPYSRDSKLTVVGKSTSSDDVVVMLSTGQAEMFTWSRSVQSGNVVDRTPGAGEIQSTLVKHAGGSDQPYSYLYDVDSALCSHDLWLNKIQSVIEYSSGETVFDNKRGSAAQLFASVDTCGQKPLLWSLMTVGSVSMVRVCVTARAL